MLLRLSGEVLPGSLVPPVEVLEADAADSFSDIFPQESAEDFSGILGDYRGGEPSPFSPLRLMWSSIHAYRSHIYQIELDSQRTDETRRALFSSALQDHLVVSIDKSFANLTEDGVSPDTAVDVIGQYVDSKDGEMMDFYDLALDTMTVNLAALESGQPSESAQGPLGLPQLASDRDFLRGRLRTIRLRQQRLRFEWLSAASLLNLLREAQA